MSDVREERCEACGQVGGLAACPVCGSLDGSAARDQFHDRAASARDQTANERDQTLSDRDQTGNDQDQTSADRDQAASDSDQRSSDDDQDAADDDRAAGSDRATYDKTTEERDQATDQRAEASDTRDDTAAARHDTANERDRIADLRDLAANERDLAGRMRDLEEGPEASWDATLLRAARDRERAAIDRERAADDRAQAAADRKHAARERTETLRIHTESTSLLNEAATDHQTGARTRYHGLDEATRELVRAHRTGARLQLAFIDIDDLTQINESQGHPAGDMLLRLVGETILAHLRPYDVITRYGGDEFVCAMPNLEATDAEARLHQIAHALASQNATYTIAYGLAQATPGDTIQELIGRAEADLRDRRSPDGVEV